MIADNKRIVMVAVLLCLMVFIFAMSAKPIDESVSLSSKVDRLLCSIFVPGYGEMEQAQQTDLADKLDFWVRKAAHFLEYLALGSTLYLTAGWFLIKEKVRWTAAVLMGAGFAALDEFHQYFVPGRDCALRDVIIDTAGIIAGIILILSIKKLCLIRRKLWHSNQMEIKRKKQ